MGDENLLKKIGKALCGAKDIPACVDSFKIDGYIDGLTSFIQDCKTPMTIAIQGDWGTGKTSIMNMVQNRLIENNSGYKENCILFNTWQFSQFNMDEALPLLMLRKFTSSLKKGIREEEEEKIGDTLIKLANVFLNRVSNGYIDDVNIFFQSDFIDEIDGIKKDFEKLIKKRINKTE